MSPQVLIPVALAAAAGAASVAIGATTIAAAAISVAATAIAAGASYLLQPSINAPRAVSGSSAPSARQRTDPVAAPANAERTLTVAQAVPPRRFVYGPCRVAGALFFQDNNNPYVLIGSLLSDGTIEEIESVYLGDETIPVDGTGAAVSSSRFTGNFNFAWTQGLTTQTVDTLILGSFPETVDANFRQQGVARGVVRLKWGTDAATHQALWGNSLSPSFKGRFLRVYDPRDVTQTYADPTTWKYSANPALCIAHALTNAWGVALKEADIDWTLVTSAANACDVTVSYQGDLVPIFQLAGIFQGDVEFGAQIADMLTACRGKIVFSNGKYGLIADSLRSSVWTVTDDDILELGEYTHATESRALFNAISATYYDSSDSGERGTTALYQLDAAVTAEGLRETQVTLPFTPDSHSAQIIAYRELVQSRDGRAFTVRLTDAALYLLPSEVITFATTEALFVNGDFEVIEVQLADVGAIVTLKGYSADAYVDPTTYLV